MLVRFHHFFNSLKIRIITSAILMSIILLPAIGFIISKAYEKQVLLGIKNELTAYSYAILAVADIENQQLIMPEYVLDNQFNMSESGLYALFSIIDNNNNNNDNSEHIIWRSNSLLAVDMPKKLNMPNLGESEFYQTILPSLQYPNHFIYSFTVSFEENSQSSLFTLHIIKEKQQISQIITHFKQQLWAVLLLLMLILMFVQLVWLMWSLKPLSILKKEIQEIKQGRAQSLKHTYPQELSQVTHQLNALLQAEQNQRTRYRNALSDLAHSLKTPLAVMQSQNNGSIDMLEQIDRMNKMVEHQLKKAQSAGQTSWYLGVDVEACVQKLQSSLLKIYYEKALTFHLAIDKNAKFKGDETDLFEILGNLLDNAAKAAKSRIHISIQYSESTKQLICHIEDDGPGIHDDIKQRILQRGVRADTYTEGHGIGLAIVRDLVNSYQGELHIKRSTELDGAYFLLIFPDK